MSDLDILTFNFQRGLQLKIRKFGEASIEFELKNRLYGGQIRQQIKEIFYLVTCFGCYCMIWSFTSYEVNKNFLHNKTINLCFLLYFAFIIYGTLCLTKREKLLLCADFALQAETERFPLRRSNIFISYSDIHDIRLNEVIEDIDIHYILIVRTKGTLFASKPIIPLFNSLKPTLECLELIYQHLNKSLQHQSIQAT